MIWKFWQSKSLEDHLRATKKVKINGILFKIKKIDPLAYADGSKALIQIYDTYKVKSADLKGSDADKEKSATLSRLKQHYRDTIISGVIKPKLVRKQKDNPEAICVDELFADWDLVNKLYMAILVHTYGKKKVREFLRGQSSSAKSA